MAAKSHVQKILNLDIKKEGIIHDVQYDFYGKKMATCSSTGVVSIYDMTSPNTTELVSFQAHSSSIWQIGWANPRFGNILATCGFDRKVIIWKENFPNDWVETREYLGHDASVNSVAWAPWEFGLKLVAASSDGHISYTSKRLTDETWDKDQKFLAHEEGVNAVVWGPVLDPDEIIHELREEYRPLQRIMSASCDHTMKIWRFNYKEKKFEILILLREHTDWVRDVAWCSSNVNSYDMIASCSEDKSVILWKINYKTNEIKKSFLAIFEGPVWRVHWSFTGCLLAVSFASSSSDNTVRVYQENEKEEWEIISALEDDH